MSQNSGEPKSIVEELTGVYDLLGKLKLAHLTGDYKKFSEAHDEASGKLKEVVETLSSKNAD